VPVQPVLILIVAAIAANLVLLAFILAPPMLGRPRRTRQAEVDDVAERQAAEAAVVSGVVGVPGGGVSAHAYDRIVRIVAWFFLLSTAGIVAATGLWAENELAILLLLTLGGLFVEVVHDLLPAKSLGSGKFVIEGSAAITVATLLIALTGGVSSPFFFVFPLIVAAGALVVEPPVTVALAAVAAVGYVLAVVTGTASDAGVAAAAATVGVNLTGMILLTYAAMVIAREQRRTRDAAIRQSMVDPLTGLFNRNFFFAAIGREIARSARSGRGFSLLMMDLDDLKAINDRLGHHQGDRVLRGVGEIIAEGVRRIDTAARYGGDEFAVLLPETDPSGAFVLAEKIRQGVNGLAIDAAGPDSHPSISIGAVSFPADGRTADQLMISADEAMYVSKRGGKDRVTSVPIRIHGGRQRSEAGAATAAEEVGNSGVASKP
jgi:diguanylate cyclase (GGDEF)-like protein